MNRDFEALRAEPQASMAFDEETAEWDAASAPVTGETAANSAVARTENAN